MKLLLLVSIGSFVIGHVYGKRIIPWTCAVVMKVLWKLGLYNPPQ
jgi:hypothetical protein